MIRRGLVFVLGMTVVLSGVCLLSYVRQFGCVNGYSIGMRKGTLTYVWRATSITDAMGFFIDDPSAVNRAMYWINAGAWWRQYPAWPWLLGAMAAAGYALILPPIRRLWKHAAPRWLIGALIAVCVLLAALWTTTRFVIVAFDSTHLHVRLEDGSILVYVERTPSGLPWGKGWNVYRGFAPLKVGVREYFAWRGGNITSRIPLGILFVGLVVPTIVLARPDRRAWPGHCRRCAYDLTGNESGVCPECGMAVGKPSTEFGPNSSEVQHVG